MHNAPSNRTPKLILVKTFYVALVCEYPGDNFCANKDSKPALKRGCFNVCNLHREFNRNVLLGPRDG